jgi:hypothetical protein
MFDVHFRFAGRTFLARLARSLSQTRHTMSEANDLTPARDTSKCSSVTRSCLRSLPNLMVRSRASSRAR